MVHTHAMHEHDGQSIIIALNCAVRLQLRHVFLSFNPVQIAFHTIAAAAPLVSEQSRPPFSVSRG